jgi:hypothetical protein
MQIRASARDLSMGVAEKSALLASVATPLLICKYASLWAGSVLVSVDRSGG